MVQLGWEHLTGEWAYVGLPICFSSILMARNASHFNSAEKILAPAFHLKRSSQLAAWLAAVQVDLSFENSTSANWDSSVMILRRTLIHDFFKDFFVLLVV